MAKKLKYYKGELLEYELYELVDWYDPILRKPTIPYLFDSKESAEKAGYIAVSMSETLVALGGLGLSANQVGLSHRVCSINMGKEIWTMFNPTIVEKSGAPTQFSEGCLSYPGLYLKLNRPSHIKVQFNAINGMMVEKEFDGLTAVCIQHEIDHLDGKLYTDMVSSMKLEQAKRKVKRNLKKLNSVYIKDPEATA